MNKQRSYDVYMGKDRRNLDKLREFIDVSKPKQRFALITMARMLGPDKLGSLESGLSRYREKELSPWGGRRPSTSRNVAAWKNFFNSLPPGVLPGYLKDSSWMEITINLSEDTIDSLKAAGLNTVGEFVMTPKKEAIAKGVSKKDYNKVYSWFKSYGIKTVDSPLS